MASTNGDAQQIFLKNAASGWLCQGMIEEAIRTVW